MGIGYLAVADIDDFCIAHSNRKVDATQGGLGQPKVAVPVHGRLR